MGCKIRFFKFTKNSASRVFDGVEFESGHDFAFRAQEASMLHRALWSLPIKYHKNQIPRVFEDVEFESGHDFAL